MINYQTWRMRLTDRLCQRLKLEKKEVGRRLRPYRQTLRNNYQAGFNPGTIADTLLPLIESEESK